MAESRKRSPACGWPLPAAVTTNRSLAHLLFRVRDTVLRSKPGVRSGIERHRTSHHVRSYGRHQHGSRRNDDARRVHHLRGPDDDARTYRDLDSGGDSRSVYRCRAGGYRYGAHDHPIPVRKTPGDAARDIRNESHSAAGGPIDLFGEQPVSSDTRLDERLAAAKRRALDYL